MKLHNYQTDAVTFIKARFQGSHPGAAVFADPGLGKTLISLESINVLDPLTPESRRCKRNSKNPLTSKHLVIAPLRPLLSTWETESRKWGFNYAFHNLRSPKGLEALRNDEPGVYLINPESLKNWPTRSSEALACAWLTSPPSSRTGAASGRKYSEN